MKNSKSIVNNQGDLSLEDWMKEAWDFRAKRDQAHIVETFQKGKVSMEEYWEQGVKIVNKNILGIGTARYNNILNGKNPKLLDVLEIGCGLGRLMKPMSKIFGTVTGIDVSPNMMHLCQESIKEYSNCKVFVNNGSDLRQFKDNSFDFCYSHVVFQHIPSKEVIQSYISEVARVLKSECIFRFQVRGTEQPSVDLSTSTVLGVCLHLEELKELAQNNNFSILEHNGAGKQYFMLTFKSY